MFQMKQTPTAHYGASSYPINGVQEIFGMITHLEAIDLEALNHLVSRCIGGHPVSLELKWVDDIFVAGVHMVPGHITAMGSGCSMSWFPEEWSCRIDPANLAEAQRRLDAEKLVLRRTAEWLGQFDDLLATKDMRRFQISEGGDAWRFAHEVGIIEEVYGSKKARGDLRVSGQIYTDRTIQGALRELFPNAIFRSK